MRFVRYNTPAMSRKWWVLIAAAAFACAKAEDLNVGLGDGGPLDSSSDSAAGAAGEGGSDAQSDAVSDSSAGGSAGSAGSGGSSGGGGTGGADAGEDAALDAPIDAPIDALPDATPVTGLGLWWKLDSTSGLEFDFAGFNNHGSVSGTVQRGIPGKLGSAFYFAGTDGRIKATSSASLDMLSGATIELWIKLSSVTAGAIVSRGTGVNDNSVRIKTAQGNVQAFFTRVGGGSAVVISDPGVLTNQWKHVAVVNNASQLKLYIDGALHKTAPGGQLGTVSADLYLGKNAGTDTAFNGTIDDLRWWTLARTDQEVCQDAGGTPTTVDGAAGCALP